MRKEGGPDGRFWVEDDKGGCATFQVERGRGDFVNILSSLRLGTTQEGGAENPIPVYLDEAGDWT